MDKSSLFEKMCENKRAKEFFEVLVHWFRKFKFVLYIGYQRFSKCEVWNGLVLYRLVVEIEYNSLKFYEVE